MTWTGLAAAACALALLPACGSSDDAGPGAGDDGFNIVARDFAFLPDELGAEPSARVQISFGNEDDVTHSFTIAELNVDEEAAPGTTQTITFTTPGSGSVRWICRFHPRMSGTLSVEPGLGRSSPPSGGGASPPQGDLDY